MSAETRAADERSGARAEGPAPTLRESGLTVARKLAGPLVRRVRREFQWHGAGLDFHVVPGPADAFPHMVAEHATPLFRPLAGLDPQLQANKVTNLRIAAARLDGLVVDPGRRLSFWRQVGRPSRRRGFLNGMVLDRGRIRAGVGGGLCQLTNLLYWMTLHTPLTVAERWRHSYDVFPDADRQLPFGSGATCAWPTLDFQVENRTPFPYRLAVRVTDTRLEGRWDTLEPFPDRFEVYETGHRFTHEGTGVYVRHNQLWRRRLDEAGAVVAEELTAENHALLLYQPFLPAGDGEAQPGVA